MDGGDGEEKRTEEGTREQIKRLGEKTMKKLSGKGPHED